MTSTPLDVIQLALKISGCVGDGQTPDPSQTNDAFFLLNSLLTEWQLYRFIVYDLLDNSTPSTAATQYTVGPSGDFIVTGMRPDKIDAAFCTLISTQTDTYLYPFMSREGYDRIENKSLIGIPISYYYDPTLTENGVIYFWPVPDATYRIHINCKAFLGQFVSLTEIISLPQQYITCMVWNLASQLKPLYGLPADPQVTQRATTTLMALMNSISQVPQAVQSTQTGRGGIYSSVLPVGAPQSQ